MVDIVPWKNVHDIRDIVDVITKTSVDIFEIKKKALAEGDEALQRQVGKGKDILSILCMYHLCFKNRGREFSLIFAVKANDSASKEDSLTESEILGQMS